MQGRLWRWKTTGGAYLLATVISFGIAGNALAKGPPADTEKLQRLLSDPNFVEKVARHNGLSTARFHGQGTGRMLQMARAFLVKEAHQLASERDGPTRDRSQAKSVTRASKYSAEAIDNLLADPAFVEKVAQRNSMNSVRFYSQGRGRIHQMTRAYLEEQEQLQAETSVSAPSPAKGRP